MGRYATAARLAAELTNKQLATEIAALGPASRERLQTLLPTKRDKELFLELMTQVEQEGKEDQQLAYLRANIESAGKVALKALKLLL